MPSPCHGTLLQLIPFKGQDVLKNLEGTLFYYEKVAAKDGGPDRLAHLSAMVEKLRNIIAKVKNELQGEDMPFENAHQTKYSLPHAQT